MAAELEVEEEEEPPFSADIDDEDSVVVEDNVPQVDPERLEKLKNVIYKIFSKFGKITNEFYPEAAGTTKWYIFLEYATLNQALEAVKNADGYKLTAHIRVNLFTNFDKQCVLALDVPGPPFAEEQQGQILPVAMATVPSVFTQSRANTGNKKDLKKYSKIFEQKDRLSHSKASKELVDKRRLMMEEYRRYRDNAIQLYNQHRDLRHQLRGGVDTDELDSYLEDWEEETIEFFINEEILLLGDMELDH